MEPRALLPLLLLFTTSVAANTYHVKPSGNDAFSGLSFAAAWATLQHAADVALAGDSVIVHDGTYQGFAAMDNSGTAARPRSSSPHWGTVP